MTPDMRARAQELASLARDVPTGELSAWLAQHCHGDDALRAQVEQLLGDPESETRVAPGDTRTSSDDQHARPQLQIDGYEITREVSRGGQGIVYQAIQASTKRKVAIKVLQLEGDSRSARRRFEREVELVASLKHPNIVTVFDSGTTPGGQKFVVMDYVRGVPLTSYVREQRLTLTDALQLFTKVCAAVQYSHQRGVIHRDLKPSNILVDAEGEPKVLDFGLAKQLGGPEQTLVSITGRVVGTLPYMSPEQVGGNPDLVDTRTDVYALGVMLYEILTGGYPYPVVGNMADVLRHIAETDPTPPTRSWSLDAGVRSSPTAPDTNPVDDEVQTIVLKTLAKERERRYQSANELAADIERYLVGDPIEAKRDSGWYVLRKGLRRYRTAVTVAAAFVVLMAVFGVTATSLALWAFKQQSIAEAQSKEAKAEKELADAAREDADEQRQLAESRTEILQRALYQSQVARADSLIRGNDLLLATRLLENCDEELRGWEWGWLRASVDQSQATLQAHSEPVIEVQLDHAGRRLLTAASDRDVKLWDTGSGALLNTLAVAPLGSGTLKTSQNGGTSRTASNRLDAIALRGDGERVAASIAGVTKLYDASGQELIKLEQPTQNAYGYPQTIRQLTFSADGSRCFGLGIQLFAWDTQTGQLMGTWPADGEWFQATDFAVHPMRNELVAGTRSLSGWNVEDDTWWAADGEVMSISEVGHPEWWTMDRIDALTFFWANSEAASVVTAHSEGMLRTWACSPESGAQPDMVIQAHRGPVTAVAAPRSGGWLVSGGADQQIKLWGLQAEALVALTGHATKITALSVAGDLVVSADDDGVVKMWDAGRAMRNHIVAADGAVTALGLTPDGRRLIVGSRASRFSEPRVMIRDMVSQEELPAGAGHYSGATESIAVTPAGGTAVTVSSDELILWDTDGGAELRNVDGLTTDPRAVAFDPAARFLAVADDGMVVLRRWADLESVYAYEGHTEDVTDLAFGPDGVWIVSVSEDKTAQVWGPQDGADGALIKLEAAPTCVAFAPDGVRVAIGSVDGTISVWDWQAGWVMKQQGHNGGVNDIAYDPSGERIITASADQTVRIWRAATGEELLVLRGHTGAVNCVLVSADGDWIVSGSDDETVRIWDRAVGAR